MEEYEKATVEVVEMETAVFMDGPSNSFKQQENEEDYIVRE